MQWASEETSETNIVTQSTIRKSSARQRGAKKATDKIIATAIEDPQSLEVQNFIAGQYPPVEEGVSSTVRLDRAFVSGALGKRTDDPKIFGAAINIIECSVRLQTTNKKAKTPVSAAPPNLLDSVAEGEAVSYNTTFDVQLSQSATDLGTQIDLPGGDTEIKSREKYGNKDVSIKGVETPDTPVNPGLVATPLLPYAGGKSVESGRHVLDDPEMSDKQGVGAKTLRSPRNVILAEFNRMMEEVDVSTLVQKEHIRSEPHYASAASLLNVVSGGVSITKQKTEATFERLSGADGAVGADVATDAAVTTTEIVANVMAAVPSEPSQWEIKYAERQWVTRITAAKSLLKDELRKTNPSSSSIAAFRKAAYGDESQAETYLDTGSETTKEAKCSDVAPSEIITLGETRVKDSVTIRTVDVQYL